MAYSDSPLSSPPAPSSNTYHRNRWLDFLIRATLGIITSPYRRTFKIYTWRPLKEIRAADGDRKKLMCLVREWKADKYQELQSVQVASSFCAGATLAVLSWIKIPDPIWVASAFWYCSLSCSIWAVITSIQQKSILDELPDQDVLTETISEYDLKRTRRVILRYKKRPGIAHWIMLFIWQFPSMQMSYSWCAFLAGLTVYICTPFIRHHPWDDNSKIAITYLVVGGVSLITFLFSSGFVYAAETDSERSAANSRVNTGEAGIGADNVNSNGPLATNTDAVANSQTSTKSPLQTVRSRGLLIDGSSSGPQSNRTLPGKNKGTLLI
ncbi:hypothetical protein K432DRAFT_416476 [Lepidopterella palustris CBS 459.81]|uniref:Uncharacterized protein n=1 Tax=Lepidopterella palustris CBS 459.81 TaxID=1314670 RepID=A0A8E2EB74_9PEZI|nr:hypothetical protein K432DRAFT_416476 [Lepidopterella palustris CBS 459.81]